ncbi:MAG: recombinase family protein [Planctomycetota bacterium]
MPWPHTDRQEQSIPDQKRAIERHAAEHELRLLRFYTDDAISGSTTLNKGDGSIFR